MTKNCSGQTAECGVIFLRFKLRTVVINVTSNVFWMYFPSFAIWFALSISGNGDSVFEGPGLIFVACVMYGVSIQKLSDIEVIDIWAYRLFSLIGFSLSLILAVVISYDTYTSFKIIGDNLYVTYIEVSLALLSIVSSTMVAALEIKYNKAKQQGPTAGTR